MDKSRRARTGKEPRINEKTSAPERSRGLEVRETGLRGLEYVGNEMVTGVVSALAWILVVPLAVVHRNLHFGWVAIVHAVAAAVVFAAVEVLWIEDIRVVVESRAVAISSRWPHWSIAHWLRAIWIAIAATRVALLVGSKLCTCFGRSCLNIRCTRTILSLGRCAGHSNGNTADCQSTKHVKTPWDFFACFSSAQVCGEPFTVLHRHPSLTELKEIPLHSA